MADSRPLLSRINDSAPLSAHLHDAILALGNFDGFHLGHQAVASRAIEWARAEGRPAIIATFDPHPVRLFKPETPPFRLTTLDQRERLFAKAGADAMMVFNFNPELAAKSAEEFVATLANRIGAAGVVTGEDFTFGKGRSGTVARLKELGAEMSMRAEAVASVADESGEPVSSSRIRDALREGDCATATRLLTRPFAIEGVVQHGAKLGRTLDFPTANITLGSYLRPAYGVYAVRGRLPDGRVIDGVANLGIRPMFDPPKELLETYFFDCAEDLYDQTIEVQLIAHLRPEQKYDGLDALKSAIASDCEAARHVLGKTPRLSS